MTAQKEIHHRSRRAPESYPDSLITLEVVTRIRVNVNWRSSTGASLSALPFWGTVHSQITYGGLRCIISAGSGWNWTRECNTPLNPTPDHLPAKVTIKRKTTRTQGLLTAWQTAATQHAQLCVGPLRRLRPEGFCVLGRTTSWHFCMANS